MPHADLLRRLLPPVSYDPNGPKVHLSTEMEGRELDRVLADLPHAVGALKPFTYREWIEDYERIYQLPHACLRGDITYQERLQFVALAMRERAGISIDWLQQYTHSLSASLATSDNRPPFYALAFIMKL